MCDYRCGSRVYGDLHCNWRGFGQTCRFCFHDPFEAYLADESAKLKGSRVILCATHEPPVGVWSNSALSSVEVGDLGSTKTALDIPVEGDTKAPDVGMAANASTLYSGDITRGEMCAFMTGYFEFLPETRVAVSSVTHFMAGMKVGIATSFADFHAFNR